MTPQIEIRHARPEDAPAIAATYNHGIEERSATFETRLREPGEVLEWLGAGERFPVLVADDGDDVAGWARIGPYSPRAAYSGVGECQVYVHPAHRRRGIGAGLAQAVATEAEQHGYWKLIGRLFSDNQPSVALVRRCGFRDVGVHQRHGRLDGEWRDVLVVELLLRDAAR